MGDQADEFVLHLLNLLAVGNIRADTYHPYRLVHSVINTFTQGINPAYLPVRQHNPVFVYQRCVFFQRLINVLGGELTVFGVNDMFPDFNMRAWLFEDRSQRVQTFSATTQYGR